MTKKTMIVSVIVGLLLGVAVGTNAYEKLPLIPWNKAFSGSSFLSKAVTEPVIPSVIQNDAQSGIQNTVATSTAYISSSRVSAPPHRSGSSGGSGGSSGGTSDGSHESSPVVSTNDTSTLQPTTTPTVTSTSTTVAAPTSTPVVSSNSAPRGTGAVCNRALIKSDGLSPFGMIDLATCEKLNALFAAGSAAGNAGDLYDNRDGYHVNFCDQWSPNPSCPPEHRLFPQHDWRSSSSGRALSSTGQPTIGQASYSGASDGSLKHSIVEDLYQSQSGANTLYEQYVANNLYMYPSLDDETGASNAALIANTPYTIATRQYCDCGAGSLRLHAASGSELPFVELAMAGLAAFKPDVKGTLTQKGMLMPTLEAMIRYAHTSVDGSDDSYMHSVAQGAADTAHVLSGGVRTPAYNAGKLVDMVNGLSLSDVPPVAKLSVVSESFAAGEKVFDTPGAIARSVSKETEDKTIEVSAAESADLSGSDGLEYHYVVIGDASGADIAQDGAKANITFHPSREGRIDVGVFVRRQGGRYLSVPAIISVYVKP
ncbi:MAG TPA: hypothetical protein VIR98_02650 [Candidatus Paceibacterota bacterium]|jgi:Predicted solute binding protein